MGDESHAARSLLIAFSAVIVCFIVSTIFSQRQAGQIGALADSLSNNAMPSIERLTSARTELHHVQAIVNRYSENDPATRESTAAALAAAQTSIDEDVDAYLSLPVYPGERDVWRGIRRALGEVDDAVATMRAFASAGDVSRTLASVGAVRTACDRASAALLADIEFNAKNGAEIGYRIERLRDRSRLVAYALDAVSVLLSGLAYLFAIRAVSSNTKLLRRHNQLLSERAGELEQFAGRVAHDIRSPIATAAVSLSIVQRQIGLDPKVEEVAARGLSSLRRASRFIEGLLEFARAGANPRDGARAEVRKVIEGLITDLRISAEEARAELRAERLTDGVARCDPNIVEVLVANLVRNAIKYLGAAPVREITVRAVESGPMLRIEVEDSGPGVPVELRRSIFEPFVRGPTDGQPGVGLGLATVKRMCEKHGGRVGVDPRPGTGSIFWFELPRASG